MARAKALVLILVLLLILATTEVAASDFSFDAGIAPRFDFTYSVFLSSTIQYNPRFFSSITLQYNTEEDETSQSGNNLTETTSIFNRTFSADMDVLGFSFVQDPIDLGIAAAVSYINFRADEELLYKADPGFLVTEDSSELLLSNQRTLQVLLPTIALRYEQRLGPVRVRFGGEYTPAVYVFLDQEADTDPPLTGFTADGPVQTSGLYQSGQSFSVNGGMALFTPVLVPSVGVSYTHLPISYDIATIGGEQRIDTLIRELTIDVDVAISALKLAGFSPLFRTRYERSWTEIDNQDDVVLNDEWIVFVGVTRF